MKKPALTSISAAFPHPVEQDEIHIPRSLFYLSTSSMLITFILLIVSLCDLGYFSYWLTPPSCIFTLVYFGGVLYLSRMERTEEDPTYFSTVVIVGYVLTFLWLIAFILTVVIFATYPHIVEGLEYHGLHSVTVGLQRFECFLCIVNLGLVGWFTIRAHIIAMMEGNPDHWRILVEKGKKPAGTREIRVQHPANLNDPSGISDPRAAPSNPHAPPDWVTAAVLEDDDMEVAKREHKPQIEITSPSLDDVYDEVNLSDYYEGSDEKEGGIYSGKGHFDVEELYHQAAREPFDRVPSPRHAPPLHDSSDADSIYEDGDPESPERWSEEEEEEYHTRTSRR